MLVELYRLVKVKFSFKNEIEPLTFVCTIKDIGEQGNIETLTITLTIGGLNLQ